MKKEISIFLGHIQESINRIKEFTEGISKKEFINSIKSQDAVIRRLEIIGEAIKNIPKSFRDKHTEVPWSEIARMRDKLIHGYFGVDMNITWNVIKKDLPDLEKKVKSILDQLQEKSIKK